MFDLHLFLFGDQFWNRFDLDPPRVLLAEGDGEDLLLHVVGVSIGGWKELFSIRYLIKRAPSIRRSVNPNRKPKARGFGDGAQN